MQSEQIRQSSRSKARPISGSKIRSDAGRLVEGAFQMLVIAGSNPAKYTGRAPMHLMAGYASVFQRFPGDFKKQTLLGIHTLRLTRRDTKERCIETINLVEKSTPSRGRFSRRGWPRGVILLNIPTFRGHLGDRIHY